MRSRPTLTDSVTMLRRNLRRMRRYPMIFYIAGIPVVLLLLFVFVFGGTLGRRARWLRAAGPTTWRTSRPGSCDHRRRWSQGTAIAVAMDMNEGIIARFRTMAISRASVLTAHVIANVIQTMLAIVIVFVVANGHRVPARPPVRSNGLPPPASSR